MATHFDIFMSKCRWAVDKTGTVEVREKRDVLYEQEPLP